MEKATELEYLQWFYSNADFGPGDGDVRYYMNKDFVETHKKELPDRYEEDE
jgi:hypothetical protein